MRFLVRHVRKTAEKKLGVSAEYLERLGETSFSGFLKFLAFLPVAGHGKKAPKALLHAVRIVATQHEDCGPCVQIAVNVALDDGLSPDLLRAIVMRQVEELPGVVTLAVQFAEGVAAADGSDAEPRSRLEAEFGATVVTDLALAVATARVFPTLKRGLGFAQACRVGGIEFGEGDRS